MEQQVRKPHLILIMALSMVVNGCGKENLEAQDQDEQLAAAISVELPEGTDGFTSHAGEPLVEEVETAPIPRSERREKIKVPLIKLSKKFMQEHCEDFESTSGAKGKERLEELSSRTDLSGLCATAVKLAKFTIKFHTPAKAEKGGAP